MTSLRLAESLTSPPRTARMSAPAFAEGSGLGVAVGLGVCAMPGVAPVPGVAAEPGVAS
jgi:hypothetical protein